MNYPLQDDHDLARVAQYYLVEKGDLWAKADYLDFLKEYLLRMVESEELYMDLVSQLKTEFRDRQFSEIVRDLDFPRFPQGEEDPLRLLARLPLPIFITTSPYNFLEYALEANGKQPRTQVILWSRWSDIRPEHSTDPSFHPTPVEPVVYHLYGLEDYPYTLVISEDDYLNFLKHVIADTNTREPIIPLRLRQAFAESSLLLFGYDQHDWDFRVLFSLITDSRRKDISPRSLIVLSGPEGDEMTKIERSLEYWLRYFDRQHFGIEWGNSDQFVRKLWDEWDYYRK